MKVRHLCYAVAASILAAACSEADEPVSRIENNQTLQSIYSGTDRFNTRVTLSSEWENGDGIGVYMLDAGTGNIRNSAMNIQYNADVKQTSTKTYFVAASTAIGIYDQACDFIGYYPYSSGDDGKVDAAAGVYRLNLEDQSAGVKHYDLMWAKAEEQTPDQLIDNGLSLTFRHQLALLYVNIGNENVNIESVKVNGLSTNATFDLIQGTLSAGDEQKAITLQKVSDQKFAGVMLPSTAIVRNLTVSIVADGKPYQYTVPATSKITELKAGYEYTFNINLKNADGELIEGGEAGNEGWNPGENEDGDATETNPHIPIGYETIAVNADKDLSTVLQNASGKVALLFAKADNYVFKDNLLVPAAVTELMLLGAGDSQVSVTMKRIINSGLQKLTLQNLNITGESGGTFLSVAAENNYDNQFAEGAVVKIDDCELTGMRFVYNWEGGKDADNERVDLGEFVVDNCYIHDVGSVFESARTLKLTITNSTFYKMSGQAFHPYTNKGFTDPTILVDHCTLVSLDKTPIEGTGKGCNITYQNNVSAMIDPTHNNLSYNTSSSVGENNFAAKNDEDGAVATGGFKNVVFNTDYKVSDMFENASEGDFTLKLDIQAGDPRWYKPAE